MTRSYLCVAILALSASHSAFAAAAAAFAIVVDVMAPPLRTTIGFLRLIVDFMVPAQGVNPALRSLVRVREDGAALTHRLADYDLRRVERRPHTRGGWAPNDGLLIAA